MSWGKMDGKWFGDEERSNGSNFKENMGPSDYTGEILIKGFESGKQI